MEKQTLHGIGQHEKCILEIKETMDGVEIWIFGPRGGVTGYIIVDKEEFASMIDDAFLDFTFDTDR